MNDVAIKIENISKLYRLGEIGTGTISHDLNRFWHRVRGKEDPYAKVGEENKRDAKGGDYVWALKDMNFEVGRGDVLGIIGKNGAGKSTLLKILSRVTAPTTGSIQAKGRIASLLEVGTGFHPELTGRDNIFLNGAILGMTKKEIKRKFDEIVDFSGVERYIDTPVKRYSSGMYVRLAFAVAAHLESEILIVDEVLAVGDIEFQTKCLGKMSEVSKTAHKTILFVSHNMSAIKSLCNKGLYMRNGTMHQMGNINDVIENYLATFVDQENNPYLVCEDLETEEMKLNSIRLLDDKGNVNTFFLSNSEITIELEYDIKETDKNTRIIVGLKSNDGTTIFETSDVSVLSSNVREKGSYISRLQLPGNLFNIGRYFLTVVIDKPNEKKMFGPLDISFSITDLMNSQIGIIDGLKPDGVIHPDFKWEVLKG